MSDIFKIVVFVPLSHSEVVRQALGDAGAGALGKYSHCSFSMKGIGRYKPLKGADPAIGEVGKLEEVEEERIEVICNRELVKKVVAEVRKVHPYEEIAMDIYPVLSEDSFN